MKLFSFFCSCLFSIGLLSNTVCDEFIMNTSLKEYKKEFSQSKPIVNIELKEEFSPNSYMYTVSIADDKSQNKLWSVDYSGKAFQNGNRCHLLSLSKVEDEVLNGQTINLKCSNFDGKLSFEVCRLNLLVGNKERSFFFQPSSITDDKLLDSLNKKQNISFKTKYIDEGCLNSELAQVLSDLEGDNGAYYYIGTSIEKALKIK